MGGFTEWRKFFYLLFTGTFAESLPHGTEFDSEIIDLTQFVASMMHGKDFPYFDGAFMTQRIQEVVAHHINAEHDPSRPIIRGSTVVLLDTAHQVPRNKAATQKERDATGVNEPHMDETLYEKVVAEHPVEPLLFIDHEPETPMYHLPKLAVWRSVNLRFQLTRLITHQLVSLPLPDEHVMIIDDGIYVKRSRLAQVRRLMIDNNAWQNRSAFEQECLVYQCLIEAGYYSRIIVYPDRKVARHRSDRIGEADIKVLTYLRRHNGVKRFLIVNQDTDLIFILLLHMPYFLSLYSPEEQAELAVWLDTQQPKKNAKTQPYRYVNIISLYHALNAFLAKEFPSLLQPLETLIFVVFSHQNDFVPPFASSLDIKEAAIWNHFCALHHNPRAAEGYILFESRLDRQLKRFKPFGAHPLQDILVRAVQYDAEHYTFLLSHRAITRFYYSLCQEAVSSIRGALTLSVTQVPMSPAELIIAANEVMLYVEAHRLAEEAVPIFRDYEQDPTPPEDVKINAFVRTNRAVLAKLLKKKPRPTLGLPTEVEMATRIAHIEWYMNYCRNGWRSPDYATMCNATRHGDETQSRYGWREKEVSTLNSTYYATRYEDGQLRVFETEETTQVYLYS